MLRQSHVRNVNRDRRGVRRRATMGLSVSLIVVLVALPPAAALAEFSAAPHTVVSAPPLLTVTTDELEPILSSIPIGDLGMSEAEIGTLISGLNPGLGAVAGPLSGVVSALLSETPTATFGELVEELGSQSGLLGTLLNTFLPGLSTTQIVESLSAPQLESLLGNLTGGNPRVH